MTDILEDVDFYHKLDSLSLESLLRLLIKLEIRKEREKIEGLIASTDKKEEE